MENRKYNNNELLNEIATNLGWTGQRIMDNNLLLNIIAETIGKGGGGGVDPEQVEEIINQSLLVNSKMNRVELFIESISEGIKDKDGNVLDFDAVKALVEDTTKFVTLMYQGFNWLLPTIDDNGDAIQFEGTYILSGEASIERVMINMDNELSVYSIPVENSNRKKQTFEGVAEADKQKYYPSIKAVEDYITGKIDGVTIQKISQAEYDELTDKDPNKLYFIYD